MKKLLEAARISKTPVIYQFHRELRPPADVIKAWRPICTGSLGDCAGPTNSCAPISRKSLKDKGVQTVIVVGTAGERRGAEHRVSRRR